MYATDCVVLTASAGVIQRRLVQSFPERTPTGLSRWAIVIAVFCCSGVPALHAQDVIPLPRVSSPIVLDGSLDEAAWDGLSPLPMTVYAPSYGAPATERTEAFVAYDDQYLYLGGRLYDSDPTGVRTNTLYRDKYSGDDLFSIVLDTYNDFESAVWFTASPAGVRSDRTVSNDAQFGAGGRVMNDDWNAHWDLATNQTDEGWFVEMRIPFSTLGFRDEAGTVRMGMIVYRFIARKNERQVYPDIPPNWGLGFAKPSQAQRVSMEGVQSTTPIYVTPYVLGGVDFNAELDTTRQVYATNSSRTNEVGLDVKYAVTNNLTLDATVNTDFAQVEADSQQVNLTRFSLFFPEKRQFFQERASLFELNTGGSSRVFHSRRIGLDEEGEQVRILGGARLVGRIGTTDIGLLSLQTARERGLPSENFSVMRLRRQVFNPYSTVGAIVTSRVDEDGGYGMTGGFDTSLRLFGDDYVSAKWVTTLNGQPGSTTPDVLDASRFMAGWERRNENGFSYAFDFVRSGSAYEPRMGFVVRSDFTQLAPSAQYRWFPSPTSPVRTVTIETQSDLFLRNAGGTVESAAISPSFELEFKNGRQLTLSMDNSYESVREAFLLSDIIPVVPGDYWFHEGSLQLRMARSTRLRGGLTVRAGTFYDGWRAGVSAGPTLSVSKHLEVGGSYQVDRIRFPDRGETLTAHLASLRVQAAANTHLSATTLLQYSSTEDRMGVNFRVRYHFREGTDLWLVYNDDLNTARNIGGPRLPLSQQRTLTMKFSLTLAS